MKKKDVEAELAQKGFVLNGGTKHDKWTYPSNGKSITVPRHRELNEFTARAILKQAERIVKEEGVK